MSVFLPRLFGGCYYTAALFKLKRKLVLKNSGIQKASKPDIIPRPSHNVSRDEISNSALKVLYRLHKSGFQAFLVGGGVRDALLELHPKDFDIASLIVFSFVIPAGTKKHDHPLGQSCLSILILLAVVRADEE